MPAVQETVDTVRRIDVDQYKYGFVTDIESDKAPKGLSEDTVRFISAKKNEPEWMLEWRLARLSPLADHDRADLGAGPLSEDRLPGHLLLLGAEEDAGPEEPRRGRSGAAGDLREARHSAARARGAGRRRGRAAVAVDAVFDSVSVVTTFREELKKAGVIFCSISEAIREYPEIVQKYLGSVVPVTDNFYATLNSAVFSDGSFVYVPEGVRCPMELSTYFRINEKNTGQFERTLIIAEKGAYVSYLEGCTAPMRDENQLHAAVVELVALDDAEIKYSTVQNWYPGDAERQGRHLQLRHQARRLPRRPVEDLVDAGRDRLGDHLEVSELHPARRRLGRRVLFDRGVERLPAGRLRHQDDPSRQEHEEPDHLQGHRRRPLAEHLSRPRHLPPQGDRRAQLHQLRLAADRRPVRRPHGALYRGEELDASSSSTRRRPRRSPTTSSSTPRAAASTTRRRWR